MNLEIEPITPLLGAFMHVAAQDAADVAMAGRILQALNRYHVLVFPQVGMNDALFLKMTANLGEKHDNNVTDDGTAASQQGIFRIALDKSDKTQRDFILGNDIWHMDGMSYATPVKATLLKCETSPREGGDTGFASLYAAYAALDARVKDRLQELTVGHCLAATMRKIYDAPTQEDFRRWDAIFPRREHPLVWTQENGKSSLLIGSTANDIVGLSEAEGRALLDELYEWCTQDRFTYRHHWHAGDLVIFNNPALLHRSYPYADGAGRVMHRMTLKGNEAISRNAVQPAIALD